MRVSVSPAHVSEVRVAVSGFWAHPPATAQLHEVRVEKVPKRLPGEGRPGYTEPTLRPTRKILSRHKLVNALLFIFTSCHVMLYTVLEDNS